MTQLEPNAKGLIEAARYGHEPTAANRAHVRWQVEQRLTATPVARGSRRVRRVLALGIVGGSMAMAGTAAAWLWVRGAFSEPVIDEPAPAAPPPAVAPKVKQHAPARSLRPPEPEPVEPEPSSPPRARRHAAAKPKPASSLGAEAELIARAQAATNRGQASEALRALERYDREYGRGALFEERSAARILALCATGRTRAARAEAARFRDRFPRSPQVARLQASCALKEE